MQITDLTKAWPTTSTQRSKTVSLAVLDARTDAITHLTDKGGHGTHVAGCALGEIQITATDWMGRPKPDPNHMLATKALGARAKLVFQAINPGENIAPNLDTLFTATYVPGRVAPIHSNSWGTRSFNKVQEHYTADESAKIDRAMCDKPKLLNVWSSGNDGDLLSRLAPDSPGQQLPFPMPYQRQIGAEGAAENA